MVQLADMVCGSIYRSMLVGKSDRVRYREIIEGKALKTFGSGPEEKWPAAFSGKAANGDGSVIRAASKLSIATVPNEIKPTADGISSLP